MASRALAARSGRPTGPGASSPSLNTPDHKVTESQISPCLKLAIRIGVNDLALPARFPRDDDLVCAAFSKAQGVPVAYLRLEAGADCDHRDSIHMAENARTAIEAASKFREAPVQ